MILLFALLFISTCSTPVTANSQWKDLILSSINLLNYTGVSSQCTKDTKLWLYSLEKFTVASEICMATGKCDAKVLEDNLFALQQLDAFGRLGEPGLLELRNTFEGSWQECERISGIKYDTNYCYMALTPKVKLPFESSLPYMSAVCMPRSCKHRDLPILYNQLGSKIFNARAAFCVHRDVEKDSAFWGFTIFMIIMVFIAVLATSIDFLRESVYGEHSEKEKNIALKILLAFSLWTNAGQLLSVKEQKPGFIKSLDCIRALSMSWVVTGHSLIYFLMSDTTLPLAAVANNIWNHLILNALVSVDTFFLLSGVVVAYLFFKQRPKPSTIRSPVTWILFYLHRFLRLTPPYMIFIGFFVVYGPYIQGPYSASMFNMLIRETDACKTNWWRNLIYINNFDLDQTKSCYGISWYLAVDTQLYLVAPVVLVALYFSFIAGAVTVVVGCIGSVAATYIYYGLYPEMGIDSFRDDPTGEWDIIYRRPWIRCTPYLVGLLTGYVIATYGKRQIRLNRVINIALWIAAFAIGAACMFSNYNYDKGCYMSPFAKGSFYNFTRLGWALAVAWVILANHFGWGGPINAFMSHPIWQPFGRLSYCAYIVHWMLLYYFLNIGDRPLHYYNIWQVYCYYAIPVTILSYVAAFFWSCLFEVSTLKLEKMLIEALLSSKSPSVSPKSDAQLETKPVENQTPLRKRIQFPGSQTTQIQMPPKFSTLYAILMPTECEPDDSIASLLTFMKFSPLIPVPLFIFAGYILIFKSSKHLQPCKRAYGYFLISKFISLLMLASGIAPILHTPSGGFQITGFLQVFNPLSPTWSIILTVYAHLLMLVFLVQVINTRCEVIRQFSAVTVDEEKKMFQLIGVLLKFLYSFILFAFWCMLLLLGFGEQDEQNRLKQNAIQRKAKDISCPLFFFLDTESWRLIISIVSIMFLFITFLIFSSANISGSYHILKECKMKLSKKVYNIQTGFLILLAIQIAVLFLFLPVLLAMFSALKGPGSEANSLIVLTFTAHHATFSTIVFICAHRFVRSRIQRVFNKCMPRRYRIGAVVEADRLDIHSVPQLQVFAVITETTTV
ncbi:unnamed protein product [Caenorhabditis sp. 36 PRJEB53466]|nr:unnamed protein product [Caenorhabditis sp. 36 PRJEB53466]